MAAAGDVDADGFDDLLVSASAFDRGESSGGAVWAWYGVVDFTTDADGFLAAEDCDDEDSSVHPTATEACDGLDNNCDGAVDESGTAVPFHPDGDGDGYGDPAYTVEACPAPAGYVLDDGDCDDDEPTVHPGAPEALDGADDDCDTFVDQQAGALFGSAVAYGGDVNGDGYTDVIVGAPGYGDGEPQESAVSLFLGAPDGPSVAAAWVVSSGQADAGFGGSVAGAGDVNGDGFDDLLIGAVGYDDVAADEGRAELYLGSSAGLSATPDWSVTSGQAGALLGAAVAGVGDINGDGFADVLVGAPAFDAAALDAGAAFLYLGSASGLSGTPSWTGEGDAAGAAFGAAVAGAGDVDGDGLDDVIVGAPRDDDHISEGGMASVYNGSTAGLSAGALWTVRGASGRDRTGLAVAGAGDLNRGGFDDVVVSEPGHRSPGGTGRTLLYFGSAAWPAPSSSGSVGSTEADGLFGWSIAVGGDLNGDGFADLVVGVPGHDKPEEDAGGIVVQIGSVDFWLDGDGYAAPEDCDETDAAVHPGALEACNGVDDNCNHSVDEGWRSQWYPDADGDGYGGGACTVACVAPPGYFADASDCDDADPGTHPGAPEVVGDEQDQDCDGAEICYAERDDDGYRSHETVLSEDVSCDSAREAPAREADGDCDDDDPTVNPGASETCDGVDNDCRGGVDDGVTLDFYADVDGDAFGDPGVVVEACVVPSGFVSMVGDCDDREPAVNPAATELCDGFDNDCDTLIDSDDPDLTTSTWYADTDGDGFGDTSSALTTACPPPGFVTDATDCDDSRADVNPSGDEVPDDGADNDCDGEKAVIKGEYDEGSADAPKSGCGCPTSTPRAPGVGLVLVLALVAAGRRRRS